MLEIAVQADSGNYWNNWQKCIVEVGHRCNLLDLRTKAGFDEACEADGIMWHINMWPSMQSAAHSILTPLELNTKAIVFPNLRTRWHFDNKVSQSYIYNAMGIKTPETYVYWNEQSAIEWIHNRSKFPIVAKLKRGASSSCVFILRNKREALKYIGKAFSSKGIKSNIGSLNIPVEQVARNTWHSIMRALPKSIQQKTIDKNPVLMDQWNSERGYVYFQEYLGNNLFDTRITVIGNRAFAFQRENRKDDFRASGSGKIIYDMKRINMTMVQQAIKTSADCGFTSMAYDFLEDRNGTPCLIEMSFGYQSQAVYNCPGYWSKEMNWFDGHVLPERVHVEDLINEIGRRN